MQSADPAMPPSGASRRLAVCLVMTLFFMWGFCTVLNDVLVPHLKAVFEMSYVQTMLIQFTFFGSYFLLSLPSTLLIKWLGYRRSIAIGLTVMGLGCLIFLPASQISSYPLFLVALFVLAAGMTILQVAANPYVALLGPERTSSARLNLAQGFNSFGTLLAPQFGAYLILSNTKVGTMATGTIATLAERMSDARAVQIPYLGIAALLLALSLLMWLTRLPEVQPPAVAGARVNDSLLRHKALVMGAIAIFVYVGAEVSIGSFLVNYTVSPHISQMTTTEATRYLSFYWGGAMVGRFLIGAVLMRYIQPPKMLADNCIAAMILVAVSIVSQGQIAMWAILLVGLCNSIMFPTIFALAIKGLGPLTRWGSGVLIAAIFGGAVMPEIQGMVADHVGLTVSFIVPILCYAYVWLFAISVYNKGETKEA